MRAPRFRVTVGTLMIGVALVGISLWAVDATRMAQRSTRYRRIAADLERREQRCREIVAKDPAVRAREDAEAWDDPYLHDPAWTEKMIPYLTEVRQILLRASKNPRKPLPPLPPLP
jgi:hypothetical protein